jgi:hypothetical protein
MKIIKYEIINLIILSLFNMMKDLKYIYFDMLSLKIEFICFLLFIFDLFAIFISFYELQTFCEKECPCKNLIFFVGLMLDSNIQLLYALIS